MRAANRAFDPQQDDQGLDRLRRQVVAQYDRVAQALSATRQGSDQMGALLGQISQRIAAEIDRPDPLAQVLAAIDAIVALLPEPARLDISAADMPADEVAPGIEALELLQRESLKLMSVATMTMIHARSLGSDAFDDYVGNLRQTAQALEDGVTSVRLGLEAIRDARAQFGCGMDLARAKLAGARAGLDGQGSGRRALEEAEHTARTRLEATLRDLAQAASAGVMVLITRIQFSDELAQRLDHIDQILQWASTDPREAALMALAGAQLVALATDGRDNLARIDAALDQMAHRCAEVLRLGEAGEVLRLSAELIRQRMVAVRVAEAARATVQPAIAATEGAAAAQITEATRAAQQFRNLFAATETMAMSAHNARLITARALGGRGALTVLAVAVHESSDGCGHHIRVCETVLDRVQHLIGQASTADLAAASAHLSAAVSDCAAALAEAEVAQAASSAAFAELAQSGQSLLGALRQAQAAMKEVRQAITDLDRLGQSLAGSGTSAGGAVLIGAAAMHDVAAIYTMARERQVHERLFGRAAPANPAHASAENAGGSRSARAASAASASAAAQTDLDDILF